MLKGKNTFQKVVLECPQVGKRKLGFTIVGGSDSSKGAMGIYIKNISADGLACESGQLLKGDEIITINGVSLRNLTHSEALSTIKKNKSNFPITFLIARRKIFRRQTSLPSSTFESISPIPEETAASEQMIELEDKIDILNLSRNLLAENEKITNVIEKDKAEFSWSSDAGNENFDSTEPTYSHVVEDIKQNSKYFREVFNFKNDFPDEMEKPLCVIPPEDCSSLSFSKSVEKFGTTEESQFFFQRDLTTCVHDSTKPDYNSTDSGTTNNVLANISVRRNKSTSFGSDMWNAITGNEHKEPSWPLPEESDKNLSGSETSDEGIALSNCGASSKLEKTGSFSRAEPTEFTSGSDVFDDSFDSTTSPKKEGLVEWNPFHEKNNLVCCFEFGNDVLNHETKGSHRAQDDAFNSNNIKEDNSNNNNNIDKLNTIQASHFASETMNAKPESQNPQKVTSNLTFQQEDSHRKQDADPYTIVHFNQTYVCPLTEKKSVKPMIEEKSVKPMIESPRFNKSTCGLEVAKYDMSTHRKVPVELINDLHSRSNDNFCTTNQSPRPLNNKTFLSRTEVKDCSPNNYPKNHFSNEINFHCKRVTDGFKENYSNIRMYKSIMASSKEPVFIDSKPSVRSNLLEKYRKRHEWNVRTIRPIHSRLSKSSSSLNWTSDLLVTNIW